MIGYLCGGISRDGDTFTGDSRLSHELLHKVYASFKEAYGTVLCDDVRKGAKGNCPDVVGLAAKWAATAILQEFAGYKPGESKEERD